MSFGFQKDYLGAVITDSFTSSGTMTLDGDLAVGKSNETFSMTGVDGVSGSGEDGCDVAITGGDGDTTGGVGGGVLLTGGASTGTNDSGGGINLQSGNATGTNSSGGNVQITCGNGAGNGGWLELTAGNGASTGGYIQLEGGHNDGFDRSFVKYTTQLADFLK